MDTWQLGAYGGRAWHAQCQQNLHWATSPRLIPQSKVAARDKVHRSSSGFRCAAAEQGMHELLVLIQSPQRNAAATEAQRINRIFAKPRPEASRLGVGKSSGEYRGVVHC